MKEGLAGGSARLGRRSFTGLGYRAPPIHMLQRLRHNGLPGTELQIHYQPSLSSDTPTPRSCRAHFEKNLIRRRCNT